MTGSGERAAITVRMFARALADGIRLAEGNNPLEDPEVRDRLADAPGRRRDPG